MAISAETVAARINEQLAQRHSTSVPFDTVRRSLRASKTELTAALNELEAGRYFHNDVELGVITAMGEDAFDVEPAQKTLPLAAVDEADMRNAAIPFDNDVLTVVYGDQGHDPTQVGGDNDDPDYEVGDDDALDDEDPNSELGDDDEPLVGKTIVPAKYRAKYKATRNTCGDELAYAITDYVNSVDQTPRKDGKGFKRVKMLSLTALAMLASDNGIEPAHIKGNNNGQKRMNLSNMLRGMLRAGKNVTVDGVVFPGIKPTYTKADWVKATVDGIMAETGCKRAVARAQAEETWEARVGAGFVFNPATGELKLSR